MRKNKERIPQHIGKEFVDDVQNRFVGKIPSVIKESLNLRLYMTWQGSSFMLQRNEWKRVIKPFSLLSAGEKENEDLRKQRFKENMGLRENALAGVTKKDATKYDIISYFGLACEYLVFQNLGENVFGFSFYSSLAFGLIVTVLTLALVVTIKSFVIQWIRANNYFLPSKIKKTLFIFCGLIILFLIVSGTANYFDKDYARFKKEEDRLTKQIGEYEQKKMDTKILEERREVALAKKKTSENTLAKILKILAYAMIGFICVCGSAIANIYATEAKRIVAVEEAIEKGEDVLAKLRAKLKHINTTLPEVKRAHLGLISMFGQKDLLEKLLTPKQCEALQIK